MTLLRARVAVLLFLVPAACSPALAQSDPPNVVMIISDDQAWTDYSFMGHPAVQTPNLDQLAAESLTFTRGYVPTSLCRPSLATIISGLYPHQHGIVGNDPPWQGQQEGKPRPSHRQPQYVQSREAYLRHIDALTTMPERLAPLGYRSLQTGKWWEGDYARGGFTDGMTEGDFHRDGRHGDKGLAIGRQGMEPIEDFLDQCQADDAPFYLWYAPFLPHAPHTPPERLLAKYRSKTDSLAIAKYWAMCEWFDETCGQLLKSLDERGLAEETIVMYVCDNGWINLRDRSHYAPRSKRSPNEGGIRTPIMIRWPGKLAPKRDETHLASSIDLVPTALKAVGLSVPQDLPGINLLDAQQVQSREAVYGEIFEHDIQSQDDPAASLRYRWIVEGRYKLIEPAERLQGQSVQLYDVVADPHERTNLAEQQPEKVAHLQRKLDDWWDPS